MDKKIKDFMILFSLLILGVIWIFLSVFLFEFWFIGDDGGSYKINDMWIGNNSDCDDCLIIEFYEGCNRYFTYYFKNQHEFDERLEIGMPVDLNFVACGEDQKCIKGVIPKKVYLTKCVS